MAVTIAAQKLVAGWLTATLPAFDLLQPLFRLSDDLGQSVPSCMIVRRNPETLKAPHIAT
jgi:hypothetical protein